MISKKPKKDELARALDTLIKDNTDNTTKTRQGSNSEAHYGRLEHKLDVLIVQG